MTNNKDLFRQLTKEDIDYVTEKLQLNTLEGAKKFLIEAGIIDENGNLTPPYRPETEDLPDDY